MSSQRIDEVIVSKRNCVHVWLWRGRERQAVNFNLGLQRSFRSQNPLYNTASMDSMLLYHIKVDTRDLAVSKKMS